MHLEFVSLISSEIVAHSFVLDLPLRQIGYGIGALVAISFVIKWLR